MVWGWNADCQKAFETLKNCLVSATILRMPNFQKPFVIYCDASALSLGAILGQKDDDSKEYVIVYISRILKGAELNYSVSEKEMLAVIWAIKQFRCYIYGTIFEIITDHSALQYLLNVRDLNGRLARWAIYLQSYTFTITHRPGRLHSNADALSRMLNYIDQLNVVELINIQSNSVLFDDCSMKSIDIWENDKLLFFLEHGKHLAGTTKQQIKYIARKTLHYVLEISDGKDGKLIKTLYYFKDKGDFATKRVVPRPSERQAIIHE